MAGDVVPEEWTQFRVAMKKDRVEPIAELHQARRDLLERRLNQESRIGAFKSVAAAEDGSLGPALELQPGGSSQAKCTRQMTDNAFTQEDRRIELLCHAFNAAGDVDCVANDCDLSFAGMTNSAQDDRSEVHSDADTQRDIEITLEDWREPL